jgi:D-beta-D-heptose 7-phosphate kinase/D-beta-D-heptose 1-phosphate adenosyltransferase
LREIVALIESGWRRVPVLVVGDVMLDKYVWGEVERISPEARVPLVQMNFQDEKPGGAANVAMNLAGLGACVSVCGFAGDDPEKKQVESLLAEAGVEPLLTAVTGAPTTTNLRILSGNQQVMRLDTEPSLSSYPPAAYEDLLQRSLAVLPKAAVVVLSDYAKGVLPGEVCRTLIAAGRSFNIPVLIDPKNRNFARYRWRNHHLPPTAKSCQRLPARLWRTWIGCSPLGRQCFRRCKWNSWPSRWEKRELRCCAQTRACMSRLSCDRCTTSPAPAPATR